MAVTGKRKAEEDKGVGGDVHVLGGSEEEEKAEGVKPKRLRRLSANVIAEDDDRFVGFIRMCVNYDAKRVLHFFLSMVFLF